MKTITAITIATTVIMTINTEAYIPYNLAKVRLTLLRIFLNLSNHRGLTYMFKLWRIRLRALLLARLPLFRFSSSLNFASRLWYLTPPLSLGAWDLATGNKPFRFDCGIDLSRCGIGMVACGRIMIAPVV